jgi:CheY-like chemotaxis protein
MPPAPSRQDELSANLRSIANTFNERTGVSCRFEESGTPHNVSPQQRETLQLALREMLTNAHHHGAAQAVWITLGWQAAGITLEVHDDGLGANAAPTETFADARGNGTGGHHGLQGMRERAVEVIGEADNGLIATQLAESQHPDVILMDIRMPLLDGIEATERIRRQAPQGQRPRILLLTTFDTPELVVEGMRGRGGVSAQRL